ncbi:GNAT family N-acetyltransferase [Sporosarcina sp. BI001-red]|uniref:GNAT family N-acetyltransferase n=1 Tax=Sporosarcina sp. BI001-red TaxID=2282866 RepID=UPI000E2610AB|nr:GNAT family N-acetyltransferase [Sporosarcina sp. BI001-red]REB07087.1 GNAT family N-acetyltransferase [Sporosarcina sp. BI001-red]
MDIRLASTEDVEQLIKMRWDFTVEFDETKKEESYEVFRKEFQSFFENALNSRQWFVWIAEENEKIVSHIYVELIQKVPRPGRTTHPFAFMTNVYTVPEYRNKGIGSHLLSSVNTWVKDNDFEFVIVWPSEDSVNYYKKNGYVHCNEPMEYFP